MNTLTESHTWREIHSQPQMWLSLTQQLDELGEIRNWVKRLKPSRVIFAGAGTSAYIGQCLSAELGPQFSALATTDIVATPQNFLTHSDGALIVQFGRSGSSSETIGTLDILDAHAPNCPRLHITTNPDGALATRKPKGNAEQQVFITPEGTHDIAFAMTSSFSTMYLAALAILGDDDLETWKGKLTKLAREAEILLTKIARNDWHRPERAIFIGSGGLQFIAREMGLKVLELTAGQTITSWDSTLGFRHGPKSAVNDKSHIFILNHPHPLTRKYDIDLTTEVRAQFPKISVTAIGEDADISFRSTTDALFDGLLQAIIGQILAAIWSYDLGLKIDNPFIDSGNLSRVVSNVNLYDYGGDE